MPGPRTRTRADAAPDAAQPWATTPLVADLFTAWLTYMQNSGRSDGYAGPKGQLNLFLGLGNPETKWRPLCAFLIDNEFRRIGQVNETILGRWLAHIRDEHAFSQYSYAKAVELMKRWLRWLVEEGDLPAMPIKVKTPISPESEIAVFSDDEVDRIHRVVRTENVRDYAIFMLLVDTGLRSNELCSIKLDDVRIDRGEISVVGEVAKNKKARTLTLTESVGPLKKYLQSRPKVESDSLFLSFYSTPTYAGGNGKKQRAATGKLPYSNSGFTTNGLASLVSKWGVLAKITEARCSPHTFRHYYAVSYLRGGGDVFSLQRLLGHSKLEMTMKYARLADIDVRGRQQKFSPALRFAQNRFRKADAG